MIPSMVQHKIRDSLFVTGNWHRCRRLQHELRVTNHESRF